MKVLLDTHALLWFLLGDARLAEKAQSIIVDLTNHVLVSPASYWEIAIKVSLGKYKLRRDLGEFMESHLADSNLTILHITPRHAAELAKLPFHHRDPFDRMLIAQAVAEDIPLISADATFDLYSVRRVWSGNLNTERG